MAARRGGSPAALRGRSRTDSRSPERLPGVTSIGKIDEFLREDLSFLGQIEAWKVEDPVNGRGT